MIRSEVIDSPMKLTGCTMVNRQKLTAKQERHERGVSYLYNSYHNTSFHSPGARPFQPA